MLSSFRAEPSGSVLIAVLRLHKLLQRRDGALHLFGVDAVGHAEVAGAGKAVAGHEDQIVREGLLAERCAS